MYIASIGRVIHSEANTRLQLPFAGDQQSLLSTYLEEIPDKTMTRVRVPQCHIATTPHQHHNQDTFHHTADPTIIIAQEVLTYTLITHT